MENQIHKFKLQNDKKINDFYEYIGPIGHGNNNSVYKVKEKETGTLCAVKDFSGQDTEHEISILAQMRHVNIVSCISVFGGHNPSNVYMVMEYCERNLIDCIENAPLKEGAVNSVMLMLFKGLSYLHSIGIIHRDINPTNILLDSSGVLKIADFGAAIEEIGEPMDPSVGTRWYRAPELLFACKSYTKSIDMWAAGCILAELLLNKPLFPGNSEMEQISLIIKLLGTPDDRAMPGFSLFPFIKDFDLMELKCGTFAQVFDKVQSLEAVELLKYLLTYDFLKRFSANQCLHTPYFKERPDSFTSVL